MGTFCEGPRQPRANQIATDVFLAWGGRGFWGLRKDRHMGGNKFSGSLAGGRFSKRRVPNSQWVNGEREPPVQQHGTGCSGPGPVKGKSFFKPGPKPWVPHFVVGGEVFEVSR